MRPIKASPDDRDRLIRQTLERFALPTGLPDINTPKTGGKILDAVHEHLCPDFDRTDRTREGVRPVADLYGSYGELAAVETEGVDYERRRVLVAGRRGVPSPSTAAASRAGPARRPARSAPG
ncbi:hypothetical protein SHIRM173S_10071 [Streptomyces hirsutus]